MNDDFLKSRLLRVARRQRWFRLSRALAACWAGSALATVAVAWVQRETGLFYPWTLPLVFATALAVAAVVTLIHFLRPTDLRDMARRIEKRHPELDGLLLTAVQQRMEEGGEPSYLQYRLLQEATSRSQTQDWRGVVPASRLAIGALTQCVALGLFGFALAALRVEPIHGEAPRWVGGDGVSVTPGDANIERGDSFVVLARFSGALPSGVSLVVRENGTPPRAIPLAKSLADPVFGGSVPEVARDFTYHIEYRGERTRDFKVTVFEHPRLLRSDVTLTFPEYTRLLSKRIEDTRRVSAVEGTRLDFSLQLNKPVKSARLVARDATKSAIDLAVSPDRAVATLTGFVPAKSGGYDLQLIDAEGRANKVAAPFTLDVQPNRAPELRLASPRGDTRPSAIEEVAFEGTVWDDFGAPAYGIAYGLAGAEPVFIELGKDVAGREKRTFGHLLDLERIGAKPDDLIAWYAWAEDIGPDGKPRRTSGDMFFAEVRPFDEIFRESQNQESGGESPSGGQGQQTRKLTELQKQIISATWKLQRDGARPGYVADAKVVLESQQQALAQAGEASAEARSPRQQALWQAAMREMEKAVEKLQEAAREPPPLAQALAAEQAAYQALLRMQARETAVTRRNSRQQGGGGGEQGNQRQLDELELEQSENRYETQRLAKAPQSQERREQLTVMNRLQELARRQQDINERLKELQTALQEAKTEPEKEEIRKRLKRLEEEQRQMLADADEVRQRMDRAENQSNMSEQRQQLDRTREDLQKAADATADGSVSQALASGSRAQRQLQEMRDEMRKQNSGQFSEELRQMRSEARDLAQRQEEIGRRLDEMGERGQTRRKSLDDSSGNKEISDQLAEQKNRANKLVERATQISEQAENTEPLLSRQLYDSIRKVSQDDANVVKQARSELLSGGLMTRDLYDRLQKAESREEGGRALDLAREMLREGYLPQARQAGQRAREEIEELKRGVERAAESVLGDESEELRLARSELDALTEQLQREIAQARGGQPGAPGDARQQQQGARPEESSPARSDEQARGEEKLADASQGQPGQGQQASPEAQGGSQAGREGEGRGGSSQDRRQVAQSRQPGRAQPGGARGASDPRGLSLDRLFGGDERGGGLGGGEFGPVTRGPLTGSEFERWTERLRDVEELVDTADLRDALAEARERARLVRREFREERKKPDWTVVELKIVKPLVEIRQRLSEELARRDSKDSLAPIDRDPVPNRFAESVRRYYEELGKDK